MKRWLLAGLLALAVILLLSPGIVGLIAERSIERQLENAAARDPGYAVTTARFDRGWFTSAGQHRVPLRDPRVLEVIETLRPGATTGDAPPVLVITSHVDHGLLPVGAAARDPAAAMPALASGVSTLALELADGTTIALPGELESRIGISGAARLRYRLPGGEWTFDGTTATGDALAVTADVSADGRDVSLLASLAGWQVAGPSISLDIESASLDWDATMTRVGLPLGSGELRAVGLRLVGGGRNLAFDSLAIGTDSRLDGDHVNADWRIRLEGLAVADRRYDARLEGNAYGDAAATATLIRRLERAAETSTGAPPAGELPYPGAADDLRRLLAAGSRLRIDSLQVTTPHGPIEIALQLETPAIDETPDWPGIALATEGFADVTLPRALVDSSPDIQSRLLPFIAGGFLRIEGDTYRLRAEYAGGLLTVNGAPLPIPLGGAAR